MLWAASTSGALAPLLTLGNPGGSVGTSPRYDALGQTIGEEDEHVRVGEVMSRDIEFAAAEDTAQQAATLMGEIDVGGLPVGTANRTLGVVTVRDLVLRVCAAGRDPATMAVAEVMTPGIHHCRADDDVETALDKMATRHVGRLLVRDDDDLVVGWVTLSDISRRLLIDSGTVRNALDELSGR